MSRAGAGRRLATALLAVASVGFVAALNLTPPHTADFWTQLRVGDEIRETGRIPDTFEVAYTEARHERFVATEWLASLLWSHLFRIGGYHGMTVAKCLLWLCIFGLLVALARQVSGSLPLALALGCLAALGMNFRSMMRPESLAFLLALVNLNLLHAFVRERLAPGWLLALVVSSALWTNLHPSFPVGLAFPVFFAVGELLDAAWRRRRGLRGDAARLRRCCGVLAAVWLGSLAATLLNPYGPEIFGHLLQSSDRDAIAIEYVRRHIWEWQPALHPRFRGEPFLIVAAATLGLVLGTGMVGRRRLRAAPVLLVLGFLPLAFSAIRHIPWFEITASYFLAHALAGLPRLRDGRIALAVAVLLLGATLLVVREGNTVGRRPGFWNAAPLNPDAIEFIRTKGISGNVFHSYSYGDQLAYHFYPQIRIAMDTRTYGAKYYLEFRRLNGGNPRLLGEPSELRRHLEDHDVRAIVTKPLNLLVWIDRGHGEVLTELGFVVAYHDADTAILTRR